MANKPQPLAFRADFFDATNAPPRRDELVTLDQYKPVIQRVNRALDGIKGDFLPLAGARGIGKTCCLEYVARHLESRGKKCVLVSDDDLQVGAVTSKTDGEAFAANYVVALTKRLSAFMEAEAGSLEGFREQSEKRRRLGHSINTVLLLDNLDRVFPPEPNDEKQLKRQQKVREFFARLDSRFKALKDNFFVIIACDPLWAQALAEHDFNYLKYDNRVELSHISLEDLRRILAARLQYLPETDNPLVGKYWDDDFLRCLLVEADGITRDAILLLEKFNDTPILGPFKLRDYEEARRQELYEGCRNRLIGLIEGSFAPLRLARDQRNRISHGIDLLRRSADALTRAEIPATTLVTPFAETFYNRQGFLTEEPNWSAAWKVGIGYFQRKGNNIKPLLHQDVTLALDYWRQATQLDVSLLVKAYFDRPFTRWYTDIRSDVSVLKEEAARLDVAVEHLDELERHFGDLALTSGTLPHEEVILRSTRMVQLLIAWYAKFCNHPKAITAETPLHQGEEVLQEIYRRAGLEFPHDADIKYIISLWQQAKKSQAAVAKLDSAQVADCYKKAARVVAGILRTLKPDQLKFRFAATH